MGVPGGCRELLGLFCSICLWVSAAEPSPPTPTRPSREGPPLQFRLAGYPRKHNEGRIEVFYNQEWGTICDDDFTLANAHVLCRHLGFVAATGWTHSAKYGKGSGRIWLDNLSCGGSEKSVVDCRSRGWGNSDCSHEEDAGVICKDERIAGFVDSNVIETEQNQVEELRLRPVVSHAKRPLPVTEGIVEVRYKNSWAQVCDENWSSQNSRVVCGMLGFPAEKKVNRNFYRLYAQRHPLNYRLHSVSCLGGEVHLSLCSFEFYRSNATGTCKGGMPAVVGCVPGPLFVAGGAQKKKQRQPKQQQQPGQKRVRLKGGARAGEGRVEVLKNSEWGTVCDDRWNLMSASVVCRELGFGSAKEALTGARMGQGMGPIHMNEVQCAGSEKSLWSCPHKNITEEGCKHSEDAGVRCNVPYMGYETTVSRAAHNSGQGPCPASPPPPFPALWPAAASPPAHPLWWWSRHLGSQACSFAPCRARGSSSSGLGGEGGKEGGSPPTAKSPPQTCHCHPPLLQELPLCTVRGRRGGGGLPEGRRGGKEAQQTPPPPSAESGCRRGCWWVSGGAPPPPSLPPRAKAGGEDQVGQVLAWVKCAFGF